MSALVFAQWYEVQAEKEAMNTKKAKRPTLTIKMQKAVDEYSVMPPPIKKPQGEYTNSNVVDGKSVSTKYYFSPDNQILKEVTISGRYQLSGSAKYEFQGSVMRFSNIKGDLFLFSEIGEPLKVNSDHEIENPNIGVLSK